MKTKIPVLFALLMFLRSCIPAPISVSSSRNSSDPTRWVVRVGNLGTKENEVYVWALCQANNSVSTATSAPAVIRLGKDGTISEVELPDEGFGNLKDLFPEDIVSKIESHEFPADAAWDHIQKRKNDSSLLPLIAEQGIPLP
jgi:hypothetical protein